MRSDWILDVLSDLKTFATANDLPILAEQLDDTAIVAMAEIATIDDRTQSDSDGDRLGSGTHFGGAGAGGLA